MKPAVVLTWLGLIALAGVVVVAAFTLLQNRLLYFPTRAEAAAMLSGGLRAWPAADDFRGLVAEPDAAARATVIVFHGNAGHAGHRAHYAAALTRLGLRVILAEYPGYGPRAGEVGERSLVADAEQTIALAHRLHGAPLLLIGESMGAGVAAAAAAGRRELTAGLMLITPWDRLDNVAAHHYRWLPVRRMLRDRYDSSANLAGYGRPVVIAVAEHDRVVPARFGIALHAALAEPKRLVTLNGVGHSGWIEHVDADWWRGAIGFMLGTPQVR